MSMWLELMPPSRMATRAPFPFAPVAHAAGAPTASGAHWRKRNVSSSPTPLGDRVQLLDAHVRVNPLVHDILRHPLHALDLPGLRRESAATRRRERHADLGERAGER